MSLGNINMHVQQYGVCRDSTTWSVVFHFYVGVALFPDYLCGDDSLACGWCSLVTGTSCVHVTVTGGYIQLGAIDVCSPLTAVKECPFIRDSNNKRYMVTQ